MLPEKQETLTVSQAPFPQTGVKQEKKPKVRFNVVEHHPVEIPKVNTEQAAVSAINKN